MYSATITPMSTAIEPTVNIMTRLPPVIPIAEVHPIVQKTEQLSISSRSNLEYHKSQCCCLLLTVATGGFYCWCFPEGIDCLKWYNIIDLSCPINFHLMDGNLHVENKKENHCCSWHKQDIPFNRIVAFVVIIEDTKWLSQSNRVAAAHGGGTEEAYVFVYHNFRVLNIENQDEIVRLKNTMPMKCTDDESFQRECYRCRHNMCSNNKMPERPGHPCVSLGVRLLQSQQRRTTVRLSRRRWLPKDLDRMVLMTNTLNQTLSPVVPMSLDEVNLDESNEVEQSDASSMETKVPPLPNM